MNYKGLTSEDVLKSRTAHGENLIPPPPEDLLWKKYLEKFTDPMIMVLLVAGALSILVSCYEYWGLHAGYSVFFEPCGIFMAIILATGLAFYFEQRADKEFALLNQSRDNELVTVIRDGATAKIPKKDVVVGDILILASGDEIPADARLLESTLMSVDESSLTGEPQARKSEKPSDADPDATFPTDMVMRDTNVLEGHGIAEATAVGKDTESGKVFISAGIDSDVRTPLNEQLDRLGGMITTISYWMAATIIVAKVGLYFFNNDFSWLSFGTAFLQSVIIAVTLIVVSVPEGLPMAVTLALAYSMRRMLKSGNLVRKLHACETMGACTVICSDKTGTLTRNEMSVEAAYPMGVSKNMEALDAIALNSTAKVENGEVFGNPTEGALLKWAISNGADITKIRSEVKIIAEVPFSTQKKYMAVAAKFPNNRVVTIIKGAPEIIAEFCMGQGNQTLVSEWQSRGMRSISFGIAEGNSISDGELLAGSKFEFLAMFGILDPVRLDVPGAVRECRDAGVKVKMITGDAPLTALEIAAQAGLDTEGGVATGPEIAAMNDDALRKFIPQVNVIARAKPLDKERIVKALQQNGDIVAVTGDGTNDAPALNAAHVGLSMGSGTAVAKEASDITIIDDSFASIARAVMWGRSLYINIQRFILFQMTVNVAACLTVMAGAFTSAQSPLTVTQMLWVNLIMDTFAAMALASLPPQEEVMNDKPRNREDFIITEKMKKNIGITGGIFFIILLVSALFLEHHTVTSVNFFGSESSKADLTPYENSLFFTFFVMLQWWNLFNAKAWQSGSHAFDFKNCGAFILIAALIFVGQVAITCFGGAFFNVAPLSPNDWFWIVLGTSPVLIIGELIRRKRA